ncbi:hypothetical protein V8F06_000809 [Rhypophila decipiens]
MLGSLVLLVSLPMSGSFLDLSCLFSSHMAKYLAPSWKTKSCQVTAKDVSKRGVIYTAGIRSFCGVYGNHFNISPESIPENSVTRAPILHVDLPVSKMTKFYFSSSWCGRICYPLSVFSRQVSCKYGRCVGPWQLSARSEEPDTSRKRDIWLLTVDGAAQPSMVTTQAKLVLRDLPLSLSNSNFFSQFSIGYRYVRSKQIWVSN